MYIPVVQEQCRSLNTVENFRFRIPLDSQAGNLSRLVLDFFLLLLDFCTYMGICVNTSWVDSALYFLFLKSIVLLKPMLRVVGGRQCS